MNSKFTDMYLSPSTDTVSEDRWIKAYRISLNEFIVLLSLYPKDYKPLTDGLSKFEVSIYKLDPVVVTEKSYGESNGISFACKYSYYKRKMFENSENAFQYFMNEYKNITGFYEKPPTMNIVIDEPIPCTETKDN